MYPRKFQTIRSLINILPLKLLGLALFFSVNRCQAQQLRWLLPPTDTLSSISSFSEGLAHIDYLDSKDLYYIDRYGTIKTITEPYRSAGNFHDGLAWVSQKDQTGNTVYGFINKAGQLVISCIYDQVLDFSCNRAAVKLEGVWQYINKEGKVVIHDKDIITEMSYIDIYHKEQMMDIDPPAFHDGRLLYRDKNGHYGYRDTTGQYVILARFDEAHDFACGVALVSDKLPMSTLQGDDTLTRLYNSLPPGPLEYRSRVIDPDGKVLFKLDSHTMLDMNRNFINGVCSLLREDQHTGHSGWGVMNTKGQAILSSVYRNEPMPNYDGVSYVQVDGTISTGNKDGYLITFDTTGQRIAKIPYETLYGTIRGSNQGFHEGLLAVKINDNWGYITAQGKVVIPPQFDEAMNFQEGFAVVRDRDGKIGILQNPLNAVKDASDNS